MFRHILTIIWNNRRHNGWLIAGLFVMSTCMWYAVDYVYTVTVNQTRPLGFDWHNVYALNIGVLTPESHKFLSDKLHTKNATGDFYTFIRLWSLFVIHACINIMYGRIKVPLLFTIQLLATVGCVPSVPDISGYFG